MENNVQGRTLKKGSGKVFPTILLVLAVIAAFSTIFFLYLNYFINTVNYDLSHNGIFGHIENLTRYGITNFLAALFLPAALFAALHTNKKGFAAVLLIVGIGVLAVQAIAGIVCLIAAFSVNLIPTSWIFGSRFLYQLVRLFEQISRCIRWGFSDKTILSTIQLIALMIKEGLFLLETLLCVICAAIMVLKKKRV